MLIEQNFVIPSSGHHLPVFGTITFNQDGQKKPIVIFSHGFKGFKDWGYYPIAAQWMANQGFVFVRYNFSHNGTSIDHPMDFVDLDIFGKNNFSIELNDLYDVINWIEQQASTFECDIEHLYIIGHSRGGGTSIIKSNEDPRIKKVVTWASVADFESRLVGSDFEAWKKNGVAYIPNARTGQQMPLYFQLYEDFDRNRNRLFIRKAAKNLNIPLLIIHGTDDDTVSVNEANALHQWAKNSNLSLLEGANHTFNGVHPYMSEQLNEFILRKLKLTAAFLKKEM